MHINEDTLKVFTALLKTAIQHQQMPMDRSVLKKLCDDIAPPLQAQQDFSKQPALSLLRIMNDCYDHIPADNPKTLYAYRLLSLPSAVLVHRQRDSFIYTAEKPSVIAWSAFLVYAEDTKKIETQAGVWLVHSLHMALKPHDKAPLGLGALIQTTRYLSTPQTTQHLSLTPHVTIIPSNELDTAFTELKTAWVRIFTDCLTAME